MYLTRFDVKRPESGTRMLAGSTPVRHLKIARGEYILSLEKPGYTSFERTISSSLNRTEHPNIFNWSISVEHAFAGISAAPSDMAGVPGGDYELRAWDSPAYAKASLGDFYIDKFEVSNREFKEFIDAGGYVQKQFWNYPFLSNGRILDWEQAVAEFKDRTGLAAPRSWQGGMYPENKGSYPVTDITWYEAAAYAAFRGKRLPTIFEWEKSARVNSRVYKGMMAPWGLLQGDVLALRANFDSRGTAPVSTLPFGMSPYGAYHMAGNVREWCLNSYNEGYVTAGGSWRDPFYRFGSYGATPAFHTSDTLGFRCVLPLKSGSAGDGGATRFQAVLKPPIYTPTSIPYFQTLLRHYRYDKTSLNAKVISEQDYPDWRQITIAYNGANDERTLAALCLPRNTAGPFQVIHYTAGAAFGGVPSDVYLRTRLAPHIRAGRAVFLVFVEGHAERPWPKGHIEPDQSSVKFRDQVVRWTIDIRRGIDYLETRDDIDSKRIAYWNTSAYAGLIIAAIEDRYRTVILMSGGFMGGESALAEAKVMNFIPHIRPPKLQLVGRYDEGNRFLLGTEPVYRLLVEPKHQIVFEGGHLPPLETSVPVVNQWLDETMGKVDRR